MVASTCLRTATSAGTATASSPLTGTTEAATWQVWRVSPDGTATMLVQGAPLARPNGIALDAQGQLVVVNIGTPDVLTFSLDGELGLTGALTLYAADPGAFAGREDAVRRVLGLPGGPGVSNGDVPFRSLADARDAVERLADHDLVERAVGFVAASRRVGITEARTLLRAAALRAGVEVVLLARTILHGPAGWPTDLDPGVVGREGAAVELDVGDDLDPGPHGGS